MALIDPTNSSKAQIVLIPWDPTSPEHVERLVQQRIACGWDSECVESWRKAQESGKLNNQWIVLADSDPEKNAKLLKHSEMYPQEKEPLVDSANFFGGILRDIPSPQRTFIPIGHICLGPPSENYLNLGYVPKTEGFYWISIFYVSRALQGTGLGKTAIDTIENIAISEPLCAKTLGMNAINKVDPEREEKYKALDLVIPPFSNQDWYERRGYKVYKNVENLFGPKVDPTGKSWYWNAVFLKKDISH
ncbi:uncharacterized protein Bfra_012249 [Botrytis fragariae]|uniref:N-acetyltransferase domain-containing protein n=1 Tax=Botrytis fragariae TaxID=1964551 RepID=A0A8H6AJK6_9HELO|nr:uncharacterized protein Bfra_012249 [Botrytis fragariae]KAF5868602.1 hypothetical protein Bfra_012249 [Botrytis fragariae]